MPLCQSSCQSPIHTYGPGTTCSRPPCTSIVQQWGSSGSTKHNDKKCVSEFVLFKNMSVFPQMVPALACPAFPPPPVPTGSCSREFHGPFAVLVRVMHIFRGVLNTHDSLPSTQSTRKRAITCHPLLRPHICLLIETRGTPGVPAWPYSVMMQEIQSVLSLTWCVEPVFFLSLRRRASRVSALEFYMSCLG